MNGKLASRLTAARDLLQKVENKIMQTDSARMPEKVSVLLNGAASTHKRIQDWHDTLQARESALIVLESIVNDVDQEGKVPFGKVRLTFPVARLLTVSAYLTSCWSLADLITSWTGQIFCTQKQCNQGRMAKLTSHFTGKKTNDTGAALIIGSIGPIFGWPAALLYVLRNQFVHEGGTINGSSIFLGDQPQDGYLLFKEGWSKVKNSAEQKGDGAKPDQHRMTSPPWMDAEQPDLVEILRDCEREMDDALGILVGSASHLLAAQVTFLLGEDN